MCFSATASFTASALLVVAGTIAIRTSVRSQQWAFASIPLLFAVQQFLEGFVWLGLSAVTPSHDVPTLARAYLVFAQVLWPIWVPLSLWLLEEDVRRRQRLLWCMGAGVLAAAYLGWAVLASSPVASIDGHQVHYTIHYPGDLQHPSSVLYFVATVLSTFISSARRMGLLGLALILTYVVAAVGFPGNVISVWCYFAALISGVIIFLLHGLPGNKHRSGSPRPAVV